MVYSIDLMELIGFQHKENKTMAKKQQPKLSYGPNMGLIAGEAQVAASEAGLTNVGGAFAHGFGAVFG